jgi:MHS family shikimate/dehydroshikimate transporter-like MFS transporter
MVIESVPNERRGYYGSLVQLGYPVGVICSTGVFALVSRLPEAQFLAWGWRVPFLLSATLVGIGLFIRLRLEETPVFRQVQARQDVAKIPLLEILTKHRRAFLVAVGLKVSEIAYVSVATVFSITYVTG